MMPGKDPGGAEPDEVLGDDGTVWRAESAPGSEEPPPPPPPLARYAPPDDPEELLRRYRAQAPTGWHQPGHRFGRNAGLALLLLGVAITLHAYWATANAVLAGDPGHRQIVALGELEVLQGSIGLLIAGAGAIAATLFSLLPRAVIAPAPSGRITHQRAAQRLRAAREVNRALMWGGLGILLLGALLAGYGLRATAHTGTIPAWHVGGTTLAVHLLGYGVLSVGVLLFAVTAARQPPLEDALVVLEGYEEDARRLQRATTRAGTETGAEEKTEEEAAGRSWNPE